MSGSVLSVQWNACVHRLDLDLYSHPKELGGGGGGLESEPMLTPRFHFQSVCVTSRPQMRFESRQE